MSGLRAEPGRRPAAPRVARDDRRRGWLAFAAALAVSATLHAAVLIALAGRDREAAGRTLAALEVVTFHALLLEPRAAAGSGSPRHAPAPLAVPHAEAGGGEQGLPPSPAEMVAEVAARPASGMETWMSIPPATGAAAAPEASRPVAVDGFADFAQAEVAAAAGDAASAPQAADESPSSQAAEDIAPALVASLPPVIDAAPPREAEAALERAAAAVPPMARAPAASQPARVQQARRQGPRDASQAQAQPARAEPARGGDLAQPPVGVAHGTELASRPASTGSDVPAEPLAGNPAPAYPAAARRAGREGRTVLRVVVSNSGEGRDLRIAESSGTPSLDEAALAAVRHWRFSPARRNGEATEDVVLVPVSFSLLQ